MSTHTEGCFSRKSSGSSVYGIRWNHISFMGVSSEVGLFGPSRGPVASVGLRANVPATL